MDADYYPRRVYYFELVFGQWLSRFRNDVDDSVDSDVSARRDVLAVAVGRPAHNVPLLARVEAFRRQVQVLEAGAPLPLVQLDLGAGDRLPRHRREQLNVERVGRWQREPEEICQTTMTYLFLLYAK